MKLRMPHAKALHLAKRIRADLRSACERIVIAGSLRRECRDVGDIEFVLIEKRTENLIGEPGDSALDALLAQRLHERRIVKGRCWGPKCKVFTIPGAGALEIELYVVNRTTWGVILAIRTGPGWFSKMLVSCADKSGLLGDGLRVLNGRVWQDRDAVQTPEETDFMKLCRCGWVEPSKRDTWSQSLVDNA